MVGIIHFAPIQIVQPPAADPSQPGLPIWLTKFGHFVDLIGIFIVYGLKSKPSGP